MKFVCLAFLILVSTNAFAASPKRIVSLSLASDEILVDLLSACKRSSNLVAVSTLADDPSSSQVTDRVKDIKARVHSEPESVLNLKPDLVIAATFNRPELIELLRKRHVPLIVLSRFSSHQDIAANMKQIGQAVGCETEAEQMVKSFLDKIVKIRAEHAKEPLDTAVGWSSDLSLMAGDTLFDDLLVINHLQNAATKAGLKHWPRVSAEVLRKWNPDWIVIGCEGSACDSIEKSLNSDHIWNQLNAVKNKNFIRVPQRALVSTSQFFGVSLKRQKP